MNNSVPLDDYDNTGFNDLISVPINSCTKLLKCISCSNLYLNYCSCIVDKFVQLKDML